MADNRERILRKLADLDHYVKNLESIAIVGKTHYKGTDEITKAAVERNLQLVSDTELDILALLDRHLDLGVRGDDLSIIERFRGKLKDATLEGLKERRRLRNRLIHAYAARSFDDDAYSQAKDLGDVGEFSSEVRRLLSH